MHRTILLEKEGDGVKTLSLSRGAQYSKIIGNTAKRQIINDMSYKTHRRIMFCPSTGVVELLYCNEIYILEYLKDSSDVILPKNPRPNDYVVIERDPTDLVNLVSFDDLPKLKIYGNNNPIMGLKETLNCDIPFYSLKFVFIDDITGWIIC